jgi:hypothetical protein
MNRGSCRVFCNYCNGVHWEGSKIHDEHLEARYDKPYRPVGKPKKKNKKE